MSSRNLIYPDQNYLAWFRPVRSKRRAKKIAQQNQTCLRKQLGPRRMLWMCSTTRFQSNHEESSQGTIHRQSTFFAVWSKWEVTNWWSNGLPRMLFTSQVASYRQVLRQNHILWQVIPGDLFSPFLPWFDSESRASTLNKVRTYFKSFRKGYKY